MMIAVQAVGGDRRTWQVTVLSGNLRYQVDVDALTGQVLRIRKQRENGGG